MKNKIRRVYFNGQTSRRVPGFNVNVYYAFDGIRLIRLKVINGGQSACIDTHVPPGHPWLILIQLAIFAYTETGLDDAWVV